VSNNRRSELALKYLIQKVEGDVEDMESLVDSNWDGLYDDEYGLSDRIWRTERTYLRVDESLDRFSRAVSITSQSTNGISPRKKLLCPRASLSRLAACSRTLRP